MIRPRFGKGLADIGSAKSLSALVVVGSYPTIMALAFALNGTLTTAGLPTALASYAAVLIGAALITLHEVRLPCRKDWRPCASEVGNDALFTVPIEWAQVVNRLAFDPPVGRLYRIDPRDILLVQFFRGEEPTRYVIEDGTGRWFLDGEDPKLVDPGPWAESLQKLLSPRVDQIPAHNIDDPALYGLEPPNTVVVIPRLGGLSTIEWHIGDLTPDGQFRYVDVIAGSLVSEDTNLYGVLASRIDSVIALATDPMLVE